MSSIVRPSCILRCRQARHQPGSSSSSGTLGSSGDGHERSKRPRSESSVADSSSVSSGNSSDGTLTSGSEVEAPSIPADPPRLPTPELEDVEMAYYLPTEDSNAPPAASPPHSPQHDEQYRAILDRFNAFDSEINVLRVGISETAQTTRSSSPPPSLPPLLFPLQIPKRARHRELTLQDL
ncbi:hypothetical protein EYR38_001674 [Pleurotus pulmonarius]|nr:hypothetical protein EYR38_001674 [Pleurotus pulmonarius]